MDIEYCIDIFTTYINLCICTINIMLSKYIPMKKFQIYITDKKYPN